MAGRSSFNTTQFFTALVLIFVTIQISSWLLAEYTDFEMLKMGWILFLFLIVSALVSIFVLGKKIGSLNKQDIIFIIIEFLAVAGLFWKLPDLVPQIFSTYSIQISEVIKESVGSIINLQGKII